MIFDIYSNTNREVSRYRFCECYINTYRTSSFSSHSLFTHDLISTLIWPFLLSPPIFCFFGILPASVVTAHRSLLLLLLFFRFAFVVDGQYFIGFLNGYYSNSLELSTQATGQSSRKARDSFFFICNTHIPFSTFLSAITWQFVPIASLLLVAWNFCKVHGGSECFLRIREFFKEYQFDIFLISSRSPGNVLLNLYNKSLFAFWCILKRLLFYRDTTVNII